MRNGFTLVEILVVVILMLVLAGIVVAFWPGVQAGVDSGAALLQGWLKTAKQRALHDQNSFGVRIYPDLDPKSPTYNLAWKVQYVEMAEDFRPNVGQTIDSKFGSLVINFVGSDLSNGQTDPALWLIQPGDYLEPPDGLLRQIVSIVQKDPKNPLAWDLTVSWNTPAPVGGIGALGPLGPTGDFRIKRGLRAAGEVMELPKEVVIDLNTNSPNGNPLQLNIDGNLDIVFTPAGSLLGRTDKVVLWVRDMSGASDPTLIVVRAMGGAVEAVPVDPGMPYRYVE